MKGSQVLFSSLSDDYKTSKSIYNSLHWEFHFNYDPTPFKGKDGLIRPWFGSVFCNPPYSKVKDFINYAIERIPYCDHIILLTASRTDTIWFHKCLEVAKEIRFIKGRLKFSNHKHNAPFPSCVIILK